MRSKEEKSEAILKLIFQLVFQAIRLMAIIIFICMCFQNLIKGIFA